MTPFVKNLFLSTCCVYAYDVKKTGNKTIQNRMQFGFWKLDQGAVDNWFLFSFFIWTKIKGLIGFIFYYKLKSTYALNFCRNVLI